MVVAFAGTDIGKDPINDGVKADGGNIVFGNDPKTEVHYIVKRRKGYLENTWNLSRNALSRRHAHNRKV